MPSRWFDHDNNRAVGGCPSPYTWITDPSNCINAGPGGICDDDDGGAFCCGDDANEFYSNGLCVSSGANCDTDPALCDSWQCQPAWATSKHNVWFSGPYESGTPNCCGNNDRGATREYYFYRETSSG
ncbi:MAG: hypothetical protein ACE5JB_00980, partial [bacterium]